MAASKDDVHNFYELRAGFQGMLAFAEAALRFMDDSGIAMMARGKRAKAGTNGNGASPVNVDALREQAKTMFTKRSGGIKKGSLRNISATEPDGKHVTMNEAAKMLKMSEANIRIMCLDGRLPKPTYEFRPWSKALPDRKKKIQVIAKDDVVAFKEKLKAAAAAAKAVKAAASE